MSNLTCLFTKEDWELWYNRIEKEDAKKLKRRLKFSRSLCSLCGKSFVHKYSLRSHLAGQFRSLFYSATLEEKCQ